MLAQPQFHRMCTSLYKPTTLAMVHFCLCIVDSHSPEDLLPQAQVAPTGFEFSVDEREQVHSPAGRWSIVPSLAQMSLLYRRDLCSPGGEWASRYLLHEQRAPWRVFSVWAFSQLQCIAACLPQEQVASLAQIQPPSRPQQVAGTAAVAMLICSP
jgi:hypothetical protein